jgi:hypothetical protein
LTATSVFIIAFIAATTVDIDLDGDFIIYLSSLICFCCNKKITIATCVYVCVRERFRYGLVS